MSNGLSKVQHLIVFDDDSVLPPNSSWSATENKHRVERLLLLSSTGRRAILERENETEQFFQIWDLEKVWGGKPYAVKNTIGKVINSDGDCILIEYDCKSHEFSKKMSTIYTAGVPCGGALNFELLGIEGFQQPKE